LVVWLPTSPSGKLLQEALRQKTAQLSNAP